MKRDNRNISKSYLNLTLQKEAELAQYELSAVLQSDANVAIASMRTLQLMGMIVSLERPNQVLAK